MPLRSPDKRVDFSHSQRSGTELVSDCPCCGYPNALSVTQRDGRRLYHCHVGCAQADVWTVVRGGAADREYIPRAVPKPMKPSLQAYIERLWETSLPAPGTAVERYLQQRSIMGEIQPVLRFLKRHLHKPTGTYWSVMLAAVMDHTGKRRAAHRTYITTEGTKAPITPAKMTLGEVGGYATHLGTAGEKLAITEGIETGLSVMQATGIPTWAALSAGGIKKLILPPLPLACEIILCADHDESGIGQRAAEAAAMRWLAEGRRVRIALPPRVGQDFNDLLREGST